MPCEINYSLIEKICLALVFALQKLRHYFQIHTVHLIPKVNLVKYTMTKTVLSDRLTKWSILLQEFEIIYVSQKAIKGQALADLKNYQMKMSFSLKCDYHGRCTLMVLLIVRVLGLV